MVERKLFLRIQHSNIVYPSVEKMIAMPITKGMEFVMSIQVCRISRMNFNYEENAGKKALLANLNHQYCVPQCGEHYCCANNKKNRHCYEYLSLSHFTDDLCLYGKWWKESFSCKFDTAKSFIPMWIT